MHFLIIRKLTPVAELLEMKKANELPSTSPVIVEKKLQTQERQLPQVTAYERVQLQRQMESVITRRIEFVLIVLLIFKHYIGCFSTVFHLFFSSVLKQALPFKLA